MTREEAIKRLNKLYVRADNTDEYGDIEDMQYYEEALHMAINELKEAEKLAEFMEKFQEAMVKAGVIRIIDDNDRFFDTAESEDDND